MDNPYAFPLPHFEQNGKLFYQDGMTLRDWFAGQALTSTMRLVTGMECENGETMAQCFARRAYEMADAMLEARSKQHG